MISLTKWKSDIRALWQPGEDYRRMWTQLSSGVMDLRTSLKENFTSGTIAAKKKSKMDIRAT